MVMKKLRVGVTGNVGSGKTIVAHEFAKKNIDVIDTDNIARMLTERHDIKKTIVTYFSNIILLPNQSLDRRKLLQIIIDYPEKKKWLEDYLHPLIFEQMNQRVEKAKSPYVIIAMPLLFEGGYRSHVDRVCLVTADDALKIERICQRDGVTPEFAKRLLKTQIPPEKSIPLADDVIANTDTLDALYEKVDQLHHLYLRLAF